MSAIGRSPAAVGTSATDWPGDTVPASRVLGSMQLPWEGAAWGGILRAFTAHSQHGNPEDKHNPNSLKSSLVSR